MKICFAQLRMELSSV